VAEKFYVVKISRQLGTCRCEVHGCRSKEEDKPTRLFVLSEASHKSLPAVGDARTRVIFDKGRPACNACRIRLKEDYEVIGEEGGGDPE
jgi:hypothetical protein